MTLTGTPPDGGAGRDDVAAPGARSRPQAPDRYNAEDPFFTTSAPANAIMRRTIGTRSERVRELIE